MMEGSTFQVRVATALEQVKNVLQLERETHFAGDGEVSHSYDDKYKLAELLTDTAIGGVMTSLSVLGVTNQKLNLLLSWADTRSVTIRFKATEKCTFAYKHTKSIESPTQRVVNQSVIGEVWEGIKVRVMKVDEFVWNFETFWEIVAFMGTGEHEGATLLTKNKGTATLRTVADVPPRPESVVREDIDFNITWILHHLGPKNVLPSIHGGILEDNTNVKDNKNNQNNENSEHNEQISDNYINFKKSSFSIDRLDPKCRTPRRNPSVDEAYHFTESLLHWSQSIHDYFVYSLFTAVPSKEVDLTTIINSGECIFVPVQPFFEKNPTGSVVPNDYFQLFLNEQIRSINEKLNDLGTVYQTRDKLVTYAEAVFITLLIHIKRICSTYHGAVDCIEEMLFNQIKAAIGKVVQPSDFTEYMIFHNRKFFQEYYQPRPFCHVVRRPDHSVEGTISIQPDPLSSIHTFCSFTEHGSTMCAAINATTNIKFKGDRFVHGWVTQKFSHGSSDAPLTLVAHARQLSSFVLLLGKITSADSFDPKYGIVVSNQDMLRIPLILETIPAIKEFKKAIESISPTMQKFAQAYRNMQIEGTLFGICTIQIKPQLEKLLRLPPDSLTRELQLTQDLLQLFEVYQIPSDLFVYDGAENLDALAKVEVVKSHTSKILRLIQNMKHEELEQQRLKKLAEEEAERKKREEEEQKRRDEQDRKNRELSDYMCRIVLVGDAGVGKSCLMSKYVEGKFNPNYLATIGVDFRYHTLQSRGKKIKLQMWDTGGQQRYRSIVSVYFRSTNIVLVCLDLTNQASFEDLAFWLKQSRDNSMSETVNIIVGTKCDDHKNRVVTRASAEEYAAQHGIKYFEISSLSGEGMNELFNYVVDLFLDRQMYISSTPSSVVTCSAPERINQAQPKAGFLSGLFGSSGSYRNYSSVDSSRIRHVSEEVETVKRTMYENIDKVLLSNERLEDLTENLSSSSKQFKKSSTTLKKTMWGGLPKLPGFTSTPSPKPQTTHSVSFSTQPSPSPPSPSNTITTPTTTTTSTTTCEPQAVIEPIIQEQQPPQHPSELAEENFDQPNTEGHSSEQAPLQQKGNDELEIQVERAIVDYTKIPLELERKYEELDLDGTLRPTTINIGETWRKISCKTMLSSPEDVSLGSTELTKERNKAFDLLDCITNSGSITIDHASLHIVIASTHCFDDSLINTIVQDNINPIEKLVNSSLIVASTIHQVSPLELIREEYLEDTVSILPHLFIPEN